MEDAGASDQAAQAGQAADEVRLMQLAQRDLRHFSPIYDRYFPRIYAYCLRRVHSAPEAEDLTSQVFTRAMVNVEQYRGGFVAAWLFRIAHNVVATYTSSNNRNAANISLDELPYELEGETINPIDAVVKSEESRLLSQIVGKLPRDQQDLLRLRIVDGLSSEVIAAQSGKNAGAVRVALHRILRGLHHSYEQFSGISGSSEADHG